MDNTKLAISGAVAGAGTPYLLKHLVVPILNAIGQFTPSVSAKLANPVLEINIRQSLTGIQTGLSGWLASVVGIAIPESFMMTVLMSAAGGAILFVAGGYLAEMAGLLKGNARQKTTMTIFAGSLIAAVILGMVSLPPEIGWTLVNTLLAFGINAGLLALIYTWIDPNGKLGLVPF